MDDESNQILATMASAPIPRSTPVFSTPTGHQLCVDCGGTGWLNVEVRGVLRAQRCPCAVERAARAGIPERFHSARLDDFSPGIVQAVMAWYDRPGAGMFITGPVGAGKTRLMAVISMRFNRQRVPGWCRFVRASDFYRDIRLAMSKFEDGELVNDFCGSKVLALDDLGAGGLSDFERRAVLDVIDRRLNECHVTMVTSNWDLASIAALMDDRLASRLASFTPIFVDEADHRLA